MTPPERFRLDLRRAVSRHRGLLAGGLAAGSVASGLGVLAPTTETGVLVVRATRDLPAGAALTAGDLDTVELARGSVPDGALTAAPEVVGRLLAAPVRRGEALTDVRIAGSGLLGPAGRGLVAVPVRLADAASASLLRAGDHVDVLAAASEPGAPPYATVVAPDATVLAVPASVQDAGEGALVVLAATPAVASRLAAAAVSSRLSVALRAAA